MTKKSNSRAKLNTNKLSKEVIKESKYELGTTDFICQGDDIGSHTCYINLDFLYLRDDMDVTDEIYSESSDTDAYDLGYLKQVTNIKYSLGSDVYDMF
jgi:hypothetical protein